jgi:5-carboxymethyl-2-hydroxymuconate isomerase
MEPQNHNCQIHIENMKVLEDRQAELARDIASIKDLLQKIDTSISGDAGRGVMGVVSRVVRLEEEMAAVRRSNYVNHDTYSVLAARVEAQGRITEALQKTIEVHQVVITEYVNNKNQAKGATWMAGKFGAAIWGFISVGGLVLLLKLGAWLAPFFAK